MTAAGARNVEEPLSPDRGALNPAGLRAIDFDDSVIQDATFVLVGVRWIAQREDVLLELLELLVAHLLAAEQCFEALKMNPNGYCW